MAATNAVMIAAEISTTTQTANIERFSQSKKTI
jgi:hypothetical protein